ncbi:hypothetical protein EAG_09034 [Camponotus floridanus]|uniref:Uncharacterized protein n=1 Tax=Camponotus floridanus TaxID=104421 RepID=E2AH46_CAMFO|nr:hypothetical protein EAG_09034 [Camponotus floridanus]
MDDNDYGNEDGGGEATLGSSELSTGPTRPMAGGRLLCRGSWAMGAPSARRSTPDSITKHFNCNVQEIVTRGKHVSHVAIRLHVVYESTTTDFRYKTTTMSNNPSRWDSQIFALNSQYLPRRIPARRSDTRTVGRKLETKQRPRTAEPSKGRVSSLASRSTVSTVARSSANVKHIYCVMFYREREKGFGSTIQLRMRHIYSIGHWRHLTKRNLQHLSWKIISENFHLQTTFCVERDESSPLQSHFKWNLTFRVKYVIDKKVLSTSQSLVTISVLSKTRCRDLEQSKNNETTIEASHSCTCRGLPFAVSKQLRYRFRF